MICKCRKISILLLGFVVLALAGTVTAFAGHTAGAGTAASSYSLGDADGDGKVTIKDVTCIQRALAELSVSDAYNAIAADVDKSGAVEIADASYIQRYLAEMETPYAIGEPQETPVETTAAPSTVMPTDDEGWGRTIFQP